ncbi:MAG: UPF0104 family protein, partial [Chloroflexi bacterium]
MSDVDRGDSTHLPVLRILGTLAAVGLLVYLLVHQGWNEILSAMQKISVWQFLLAFVLTIASRLAVSGRWYVLLRAACQPVSLWQAVRITFAGLFASNFLPTTIGGDVVRLGGALRLHCDHAVCLASLIVDRLVGMAGMALAVPLALPAILTRGLPMPSVNPIDEILLSAIPAGYPGFSSRLLAWLRRSIKRLVGACSLWVKKPDSLLFSFGFTAIHMLCHFAMIWIFLSAMSAPVPFSLIAGAWSLTYFITLLPISINGLGLQELSTTVLFAGLGGISTSNALTLSVLIRLVQMLGSLPGALFLSGTLAGEGRSRKDTKEM